MSFQFIFHWHHSLPSFN